VNKQRVVALVAGVVLTAPFALLPSGTATSATGACSGRLVYSDSFALQSDPSTKLFELDVYWNASSGTNCAKAVHLGPTWGQSAYTEVEIEECAETTPGPCHAIAKARDARDYRYYAGPVSVPGRGHCMVAAALLIWNGLPYGLDTRPNHHGTVGSHCG
jgi:hypothetical protein